MSYQDPQYQYNQQDKSKNYSIGQFTQYPQGDYPPNAYQNYNSEINQKDEAIIIQQDEDNQYNNQSNMKLSDLSTSARLGFVRKVYVILSIQIGITALMCYEAVLNSSFQQFMFKHSYLFWVAMVVGFITLIVIVCARDYARRVPQNYMLLLMFTLAESFLVAFVCGQLNQPIIVFQAFAITTSVFLVLTLYAIFTKQDFTNCRGIVLVMLTCLFIGGFIWGLFYF